MYNIKYPETESEEDKVEIPENVKYEGNINWQLKEILDRAKQRNTEDWDMVFVVDGEERGGKSRFASQIAKYLCPDLDISHYAFSPTQFKEKIQAAKPQTPVVYDEAHSGFNTRSTMTKVNKMLVSMMTEIGYKNLYVFIVLPSFFDLDSYIALHRAKALFHVYVSKKLWRRGFFWAMNKASLRDLYIYGKKFRDYGVRKSDFSGCFGKWSGVNLPQYIEYKKKFTLQV